MRHRKRFSGLKRDRGAQSALIDALLFFVIMILASLFVNLSGFQGVREVILRSDEITLTRDTLDVLLKTTVNMTNYTVMDGEDKSNVELLHGNVLELMVEDLMVRNGSADVDIHSLEIGIEEEIERILDNLTAYTFSNRTQVRYFHYRLMYEFRSVSVVITDSENIGVDELTLMEKYSVDRWVNMPQSVVKAKIVLYLWNS